MAKRTLLSTFIALSLLSSAVHADIDHKQQKQDKTYYIAGPGGLVKISPSDKH